jgi:hypothetical protein
MAKRAPARNFPPLLFFGGIPDARPRPARCPQRRRRRDDPGPRAPLAPAAGDSPAVAALATLSAEPGGAAVAVIAARTGTSMPAARQALLAHEKNGTATRIKDSRPGIADTWTLAAPLGRRPHDLRHEAVSLWLNSGVACDRGRPPRRAASPSCSRIVAHRIDGQANAANQCITDALSIPRQSRTPATRATPTASRQPEVVGHRPEGARL